MTAAMRAARQRGGDGRPLAADPDFARRLAAANAGRERWDRGWVIHQFAPNGQAFVRKGERERSPFRAPSFSTCAPGMAAQIGAQRQPARAERDVSRRSRAIISRSARRLDELADDLSLTRLYFHCARRRRRIAGRATDRGAQSLPDAVPVEDASRARALRAHRRGGALCRLCAIFRSRADRRVGSRESPARCRDAALHQAALARRRGGVRSRHRRELRVASLPAHRRRARRCLAPRERQRARRDVPRWKRGSPQRASISTAMARTGRHRPIPSAATGAASMAAAASVSSTPPTASAGGSAVTPSGRGALQLARLERWSPPGGQWVAGHPRHGRLGLRRRAGIGLFLARLAPSTDDAIIARRR